MKIAAFFARYKRHQVSRTAVAAAAIAFIGLAPAIRAQTAGTALVKTGIDTLNGTLTGSAQIMTASSVTLNSAHAASISGNLYVPGTPTITKNGSPTYGGTQVGSGSASPTGYPITLNSGSSLGHIVTQTSATALAVVAAPPSPSATRSVLYSTPRPVPPLRDRQLFRPSRTSPSTATWARSQSLPAPMALSPPTRVADLSSALPERPSLRSTISSS